MRTNELSPLSQLAVWMEEILPGMAARNVSFLERDGVFLFQVYDHLTGEPVPAMVVYVGHVLDCMKPQFEKKDFVKLIISADMGLEHSKVLIENAIERVAGR